MVTADKCEYVSAAARFTHQLMEPAALPDFDPADVGFGVADSTGQRNTF
jgi:hypothetical protein